MKDRFLTSHRWHQAAVDDGRLGQFASPYQRSPRGAPENIPDIPFKEPLDSLRCWITELHVARAGPRADVGDRRRHRRPLLADASRIRALLGDDLTDRCQGRPAIVVGSRLHRVAQLVGERRIVLELRGGGRGLGANRGADRRRDARRLDEVLDAAAVCVSGNRSGLPPVTTFPDPTPARRSPAAPGSHRQSARDRSEAGSRPHQTTGPTCPRRSSGSERRTESGQRRPTTDFNPRRTYGPDH